MSESTPVALETTPAQALARGVYRAPFRWKTGAAVLMAIDSRGRCIALVPFGGDEETEDTLTLELHSLLNRKDPQAQQLATFKRGILADRSRRRLKRRRTSLQLIS